jgi:uncharacterized Tic20 family protein
MAVALTCLHCKTFLDPPTLGVDTALRCPKCATPVPLPVTLVPTAAITETLGTTPTVPWTWSPGEERPLGKDEKKWSLLAHLGGLLANFVLGPIFGFVPPVLILVLKGKDSEFVRHHAKEALNFQITVGILELLTSLLFGGLAVSAVVVGFAVEDTAMKVAYFTFVGGAGLLLALLDLYCLFLSILACIRSYHGAWFRYPHCIRFVK